MEEDSMLAGEPEEEGTAEERQDNLHAAYMPEEQPPIESASPGEAEEQPSADSAPEDAPSVEGLTPEEPPLADMSAAGEEAEPASTESPAVVAVAGGDTPRPPEPAARGGVLSRLPPAKVIAKRTTAAFAMVIASIVLIIATVGILGSWAVNSPITNTILRALVPLDRALTIADTGLTRLDDDLTQTVELLDAANTIVVKLGVELKDVGSFFRIARTVVEALLGTDASPRLQQVRDSLGGVREGVAALSSTLDAIGSLPLVNVSSLRPESGPLSRIADRISSIGDAVSAVQTDVQDQKETRIDEATTNITTRIGKVLAVAQEVQGLVSDYRTRVETLQTHLADLKARIPLIVDLFSLGFTFVFGWLAFSQVIVLRWAWAFYRSTT